MNAPRFDRFARKFGGGTTRRRLLAGLALSSLAGLVAARPAVEVAARKKHKKNKKAKKPRPNAYGCLDVGKACNGDSTQCCSGICEGSKPKKGKPDKSRCVAHDTGICEVGFNICNAGMIHYCEPDSINCVCMLTTGHASFCGDLSGSGGFAQCRECSQDTDCQGEFGPGAACAVLADDCESICPDADGSVCVPACKDAEK